mmetsp:Transcript_24321/g.58699  ORF Transcript_24321/g.58699 Transcript_24321/m.58699 type:complete len:139 (+) Transcript_24321:613-1029(+)
MFTKGNTLPISHSSAPCVVLNSPKKSELFYHIFTHYNTHPYCCYVCGKGVLRKVDLIHHISIQHKKKDCVDAKPCIDILLNEAPKNVLLLVGSQMKNSYGFSSHPRMKRFIAHQDDMKTVLKDFLARRIHGNNSLNGH